MEMESKIGIIGIGYVGLPLAVIFAKKFKVVAFDINKTRINELKKKNDRNKQINKTKLKGCRLLFTHSSEHLKKCNIYIITVPTPIFNNKNPDLSFIENATNLVGKLLSKNNIVANKFGFDFIFVNGYTSIGKVDLEFDCLKVITNFNEI